MENLRRGIKIHSKVNLFELGIKEGQDFGVSIRKSEKLQWDSMSIGTHRQRNWGLLHL